MKLAEVLNGSQFTLLSLLLAVVAYIRNIPVKELVTRKKQLESKIKREIDNLISQQSSGTILTVDCYNQLEKLIDEYKLKISRQLFFLNILQILIALMAVFIAGRFIPNWGDKFDIVIFSGIFAFTLVFFVFHLIVDGEFACRHWRGLSRNYIVKVNPDINQIKQNWQEFRKK